MSRVSRQDERLKKLKRDLGKLKFKEAVEQEAKKVRRVRISEANPSARRNSRAKESLFFGGPTFDPKDPTGTIFRALGGGQRDLRTPPSFLMDEMHRQAERYGRDNPFIRRISTITGDFIVGNGLTLKSTNDKIQKALDQFWFDPINNLEENQYDYAKNFRLRGELAFERVRNRVTGYIRLNPLEPLHISRVSGHAAYPGIPSRIFWRTGTEGGGRQETPSQIINGIPEELRDTTPGLANVFFFRANKTGLRGISDFWSILEWADSLDNAAFSLLERMINLQIFIWHYKTTGPTDTDDMDDVEEKLKNANANSVLISGAEDSLEPKVPQLQAAEFSEGFALTRQILAMGGDLPENALGVGGMANVGEAEVMFGPTFRTMTRKQREFITMIRHIADDAILQAMRIGSVPKMVAVPGSRELVDPRDAYTVTAEPVSKKDMSKVVTMIGQLASALPVAITAGLLQKPEDKEIFRHVVGELIELREQLPEEDPVRKELDKVFPASAIKRLSDMSAELEAA